MKTKISFNFAKGLSDKFLWIAVGQNLLSNYKFIIIGKTEVCVEKGVEI